ncbi:MAG: aldehyde dehydrogenase [Spirochaetes bacterium]|nr:aldehyde dehydrogenase [Spirochaetota bacterium]
MTKESIKKIIRNQEEFFKSYKTKSIAFRIDSLNKLKNSIKSNEDKIALALYKDLKKPKFEAYATEIGIIYDEINFHIKNLKKWTKPKKVKTHLAFLPAKSFVYPEPFGVVLIISPWNYPFQLLIAPLIGAISAGNCAVLKPSEVAPHTSAIIEKIVNDNFSSNYLFAFSGGIDINKALLSKKFDYIFFTGSTSVGRIVMEAASKNLTPVTLELGGKSPCIIDKDANLEISSKRAAWGKYINAGQTCVAPDYLFIHKDVKDKFIELVKKHIKEFFSDDPSQSDNYCRIISERHFDRLISLMKHGKITAGGEIDRKKLYIAPTIVDKLKFSDPVMQEEIFGPILPLFEFDDLDEVIDYINKNPKPLALYYFSQNKKSQAKVLNETSSGGVCINDTISHIASPYLPFGGVGESGMGMYHGKKSFDTFTHYKSIMKQTTRFDIPIKYPPYDDKKLKFIKMIYK